MDKLSSGRLEVVTVGYDLFTSHKNSIAEYEWLVVVFDEVHMLKNPKSKRYTQFSVSARREPSLDYSFNCH